MSLVDTWLAVRQGIDAAAFAAGRDPTTVQLIAVSKFHPADAIRELQFAGQVAFGESYAQELRDKARELDGLHLQWHFVGRIQRNKAKYVAPVAHRVHALESEDQAEALLARAPAGIDALVAVNVGREVQKSGVLPDDVLERCKTLSALDGLRIRGLMCLPPRSEDPEDTAPFFAEVADLAARGRADGLDLHELSMGMSSDAHVAVRHGATWVRMGTAIFGARVNTRHAP